jgi:NADP-dependent 3-hydroxy acid dehydrogenase YdfG
LHGPADALVNNAGVMLLGQMHEQDPEQWDRMFDINVKGLLNGVHALVGGMRERRHGTLINVSSVAGRKTFPNHVAYVGSKFAVHGLSENLREELAPHNVRVVTIAPGAVETELLGHTTDEGIKRDYQAWKANDMGGVVLTAEDVAGAILWATSSRSRCAFARSCWRRPRSSLDASSPSRGKPAPRAGLTEHVGAGFTDGYRCVYRST